MPDRLDEVLRQAQDLGLLGPGPTPDQRRHAEALCRLALEGLELPEGGVRWLDLGSGGGLPGLVLADLVRDRGAHGALLDSQQRRTGFLTRAVQALELADRIDVLTARAEDAARAPEHREAYHLVVARSFAAPAVTAECATGFLTVGGRLVVSEPPEPAADRWSPTALAELALSPPDLVRSGTASAAVLTKRSPTPSKYPRKAGIPQKRPLW